MNNNTEINLAGKVYPITFGMTSYFTLLNKSKFLAEKKGNVDGSDFVRHVANVVFAGADNWSTVNDKPSPSFSEIYAAVDGELGSEDGQKAIAELMKFYEQSTAGVNLYGALDKKKAPAAKS
jgi:hypothetical protein